MRYLVAIDTSNKKSPVVFRKTLCVTHNENNGEVTYKAKPINKLPQKAKILMIQHYLDEISNGTFNVYEFSKENPMPDELKWKIVGDQIGHQSTTKEIVEMYAEQYGYSRPQQTVIGSEIDNLAEIVRRNINTIQVVEARLTYPSIIKLDGSKSWKQICLDIAHAISNEGYCQQGKLAKESLKSFLEQNYTGRSPFLTEADIKVMVEEICGKFSWPSVPSAFDIGEAIAKANIEFNGKSPNYQWREYIGNAIRKLLTEQKGTT